MKGRASVFPFSVVLFLLNPLLGVLFLLNFLFSFRLKDKTKLYGLLLFILAFLLSYINCSKIPENDLKIVYNRLFLLAGDYSLISFLVLIGKEPGFWTFSYFFYYLSNGNEKLWIFTISFLSYILFFISVLRFSKILKLTNSQILLGLVLASFFPQLFSLSAHLVRQFIASSIFIYFAIDKIFYNNNKWWLAILGFLMHVSSLLLFVMAYAQFLGDFKKKKFLNISFLFLLLFYQFISGLLLGFLGENMGIISYALERASGDTTYDLGDFKSMNFILAIAMISSAWFYFNRRKNKLKYTNKIEGEESLQNSLRHFFSIMCFLFLFVVANIHQSELSNRLFFYLFFFFPFTIPLFFGPFLKGRQFFSYGMVWLFILFFIYRLGAGTWTYMPLSKLFSNSIVFYLLS